MRQLTPTTLTMRHLEAEGWIGDIVERRVASNLHDWLGFVDILAIRGEEILAVQTTDITNISARIRKIANAEHVAAVREAGIGIHVHGWYPDGRLRVVDVS